MPDRIIGILFLLGAVLTSVGAMGVSWQLGLTAVGVWCLFFGWKLRGEKTNARHSG